ncbi:TIMELESS-interacting protein [Tupaia chinensis]|uniref:TIMELESS-interacting protein n=1 Tax=Tupaia chinensis TaxID=246437 RepID=UPI0003C9199B|nr:TIMELESS-interacting protein [Tupaia chinensis]XP_027629617.1 TIMELESS-interacting protein [Tupaia chinensis]
MLEPRENGSDDLPDYEHIDDETFPPFPPPERGAAEGADADEESGRIPVPVPPKRTVKRNIPKLDAQRLISERGLPALRHVFEKAKFKGKGHEAEDLKMLIRHMEHWAHRLFLKLQFEDFIDRVEYLGNKKEVQTCLKRIRLDLPILHEDFVSNSDEVGESNDHDDVAATELDPFLTTSSESVKFASESSRSLTEEQQQRIERNKQLALERRQAKLLSNSQSQGNDTFMSTEVETVEEVNPGKDLKDSGGLNEDILDSSHDDVPADTVGEEEFRVEETARGQAC